MRLRVGGGRAAARPGASSRAAVPDRSAPAPPCAARRRAGTPASQCAPAARPAGRAARPRRLAGRAPAAAAFQQRAHARLRAGAGELGIDRVEFALRLVEAAPQAEAARDLGAQRQRDVVRGLVRRVGQRGAEARFAGGRVVVIPQGIDVRPGRLQRDALDAVAALCHQRRQAARADHVQAADGGEYRLPAAVQRVQPRRHRRVARFEQAPHRRRVGTAVLAFAPLRVALEQGRGRRSPTCAPCAPAGPGRGRCRARRARPSPARRVRRAGALIARSWSSAVSSATTGPALAALPARRAWRRCRSRVRGRGGGRPAWTAPPPGTRVLSGASTAAAAHSGDVRGVRCVRAVRAPVPPASPGLAALPAARRRCVSASSRSSSSASVRLAASASHARSRKGPFQPREVQRAVQPGRAAVLLQPPQEAAVARRTLRQRQRLGSGRRRRRRAVVLRSGEQRPGSQGGRQQAARVSEGA